jgi:hypothetical protein
MAFPHNFISMVNFDLAFTRVVRGQNKEYKNLFRHLYPSYQLGLRENLQDLISDIKAGRYEASPATVVFQPKKSGILRPLRLLTLQDQIVYQAIANVIAVAFKPEQDKHAGKRCFGALVNGKHSPFFYRGWKHSYRAFDRAVARAFNAGNDYVADFDLVSFYELIDHKLLRDTLEHRFKKPEVLDLLLKCLEKWTENHKGSCMHHGIPQGPEPSAFLAECFLFSFDALRFKGIHYLRYVDDIKLMAKDEVPVRRALVKLDIASKQLGLVPQAQKIECRRVVKLEELRKNIPSHVAALGTTRRVTAASQRRLERIFRRSLRKKDGRWTIADATKFKFSLFRMRPKPTILKRITPLLYQRSDLSWVLASYLRKFPKDKQAADALLAALQLDPTYDASAANYIEAMDVCEPVKGAGKHRRVIQTAERRSEEKGLLLKVGAATFRGRRSGPADALKLIGKQPHPLAKSLLIHRLFGNSPAAPFKIADGRKLVEFETESQDSDLARFCANMLIEVWPWTKSTWTPTAKVNPAAKLLLKSLGIRTRGPRKLGVLEKFFTQSHHIGVRIPWKTALGSDWRDAERRCLRLQQFAVGDPTSWVLMLDTFNEVLLQAFSLVHLTTAAAYKKAIPHGKHHPDIGAWLYNPAIAKALPKGIGWFKEVHDTRVKADLAHAKGKKDGVATKPVSFSKRDTLHREAQVPWAELIIEWKKII